MKSNDGGYNWEEVVMKPLVYSDFESLAKPSENNILISMNEWISYEIDSVTTGMKGIGQILRSTDDGENFKVYNNPDSNSFGKIVMLDENNGFVVQHGNAFKYTTSSGETWDNITLPEESYYINNVASPEIGAFIVNAYIITGEGFKYKIFKTSDFGKTWSSYQNDLKYFYDIKFIDFYNGIALCSYLKSQNPDVYRGAIYKTTDGGISWEMKYNTLDDNDFLGVGFADKNHIIAYDKNNIYFSKDAGDNWQEININIKKSNDDIEQVIYPKASTAICITSSNIYIKNDLVVGVGHNQIVKNNDIKAYPNPANDMVNIEYSVKAKSNVNIKVIDVLGREIKILKTGTVNQGTINLQWNTEGYKSGIYYIILDDGINKISKKVVVIK